MLMIGKQLTAEQRINKAVVDIMGHPRYRMLAPLIMIGKKTVNDATKTAYTNGRDVVFGRAFVDSLTDAELRFVVLHEEYHKLYRHLTTWNHLFKQNKDNANRAADYVINVEIADDNAPDKFATMPVNGLLDPKYRGMDTAKVFSLLEDEKDETGNSNSEGSGEGFDDHDWEAAQEMDGEEKQILEREIEQALRQGVLMAGKLGDDVERLRKMLRPQVDWREALREFVKNTCTGNEYSTWRRPNRRFVSSGLYLPSGVSETVEELVLAVDTSGSIDDDILGQFLGEVAALAEQVKPSRIRLLYWDTGVRADETYEAEQAANIASSTKPRGGGGTSVRCVPAYMAENNIKPQAVVVLTDGYLGGDWGQWSCPVLWCIKGNDTAVPDVGTCAHIN